MPILHLAGSCPPNRTEITWHHGEHHDETAANDLLLVTFGDNFCTTRVLALDSLSQRLRANRIEWIQPIGPSWQLDLARLRAAFPNLARYDWITGSIPVQPEIELHHEDWGGNFWERTQITFSLTREAAALVAQNRIFLSHKGANKSMIRGYHRALKASGYRPWLDEEDLVAGDNLNRGLVAGMVDSCAAVFFITPEFRDEAFLRDEIDIAKQLEHDRGEGFSIITLVFRDSATGNGGTVPKVLRGFVFKEVTNDLEAMYELVRALPIEPASFRPRRR
jgi:hypothetical protein